jgi:hypothetical protein
MRLLRSKVKILSYMLLLILGLTATACYRLPRDDDYGVIPNTNNRDFTRERDGNFLPTASY